MDFIDQCPYFASKYLAYFRNSWNNIIVGRLKEFGYENMWSCPGRKRLQIVTILLDRMHRYSFVDQILTGK